MENENVNNDTPKVDNADSLDGLDANALKEKLVSEREDHGKTKDANRQLFSRAKTAEGFEKKGEEWVKIEKKEPTETKPKETPKKQDESVLLEKFDKLALKTEGITSEDEVELANKLRDETGKSMEDLLDSKYFKSELESLRENKTNEEATKDVKGGSGTSEAKSKPEYWIAKGTRPTKEEVPDRKTRVTILRAMMASSKSNKMFYND